MTRSPESVYHLPVRLIIYSTNPTSTPTFCLLPHKHHRHRQNWRHTRVNPWRIVWNSNSWVGSMYLNSSEDAVSLIRGFNLLVAQLACLPKHRSCIWACKIWSQTFWCKALAKLQRVKLMKNLLKFEFMYLKAQRSGNMSDTMTRGRSHKGLFHC